MWITEHELTKLIKKLNLDELHVESEFEAINNNKKSENSSDGWVQVKDQTIIVHDPEGHGKLPVLRAVSPVRLIINDIVVDSKYIVSSKDDIRWEIEEKPLFEISVSDDKMKAYFQLNSKERYEWQLIDTEPLQELSLTAKENKNLVLETVQLTDVIAEIEKMSIVSNLNIAAVQQELDNPTYQPVLIASGKEAIPGKDAELKLFFSEQVESQFIDICGRVDFRNHLQIPTVNSGDLIAKKIPLVEGTPGYDVYGNLVSPDSPKDIIVVAKPSVELTPDGEIRALKSGRPRITGNKVKTFDISTSYIISGDVNIETGNIVFSGDVVVYGNVMDHMIIESLGNVYVYGSVYNATITATGSVYVTGNILGSKLYCGYFGVIFNRLYQATRTLGEQVVSLLAASKMLLQALESKKQKVRYGQIVLLLMENKFKEMPGVLKELRTVLANIQHIKKEEYQKLGEMCSIFLNPHKLLEIATINFIQSFLSLLQETHQEVARMQEERTEVKLTQCYNSQIKSNGDIIVLRDGVILSDLYATRHIIFTPDSSVCRGSKLEAGGHIVAKIVGGDTGVSTVLRAKKKITVLKMYAGRICIGKHCIDIDNTIENKTFTFHDLRK